MLSKRIKMFIKISLILLVAVFLAYKIADNMYYKYLFRNSVAQNKAITRVLEKKFNLDKVIKITRISPPVMGGVMNYYVTFKDKENNDCFIIMDLRMKKYLLIYENIVINQQRDVIIKQHEELINYLLRRFPDEQSKGVDISLNSIEVKKCKTNAKGFESGEIVIAEVSFKAAPVNLEQKKQLEARRFRDNIAIYFFDSKTEKYFSVGMDVIDIVNGVRSMGSLK